MAKVITTQITIDTTPNYVWKVLTDFNEYPRWNPFIKEISGEVAKGNTIKVLIQPINSKPMLFKPLVLEYIKEKEFRWIGKLFVSGLFDGEHKFELIDNSNGTTTLIHSEKFKGLLVPLLSKQLDNTTKKGFEAMNRKLKELCELH
ncbi:SRPBCC domain-containing protein [Flavobacterium sp. SUN046]|uniref:SRPBCC domain-containing protein n=1 Tax=Flavobacterium sp. SUN046 TaxID=3002440 RepID=UPI002DBECB77|nr:SRPBCC domain-containing protein [Flavobacterium sp. SUN046]MEC4048377.1 SRPBCC domain-containing protein [Flavobacterium sp. SUN046]